MLLLVVRIKNRNGKGLTLIELLAVLVIISIFCLIAVPIFYNLFDRTRAEVCDNNRIMFEREYELYLIDRKLNHSDEAFLDFKTRSKESICPSDGVISYYDGKVRCSVHSDGKRNPDEGESNVPYQ